MQDLGDYLKKVLLENQKEFEQSQPGLLGECRVVQFVSRREYGRRRRQPVVVELFVRRGVAYRIKEGEIIPNHRTIAPDIMACEVLEHLPWEERTPQKLMELTRNKR